MITRKEGYKVKDGKFQYAFGLPVPDPFTQSSRNVVDGYTVDGEQLPPSLVPYEKAESDTVFAYSCAKSKRSDGRLTVRLLYDTLSERPDLLGLHSIHAVSLLKLGLQLDEWVSVIVWSGCCYFFVNKKFWTMVHKSFNL